MARVRLVEALEVVDIGIEIVVLTMSRIDPPAASSTAARFWSACSVCASIPSAASPVTGSIPAIPEQYTVLPATIAWL